MPELIAPTSDLEAAWRAAHDEWGPGSHEDGFGLRLDDDVASSAGFAAWVARLTRQSDPAIAPPPGRVHCTYRWVIDDDQVAGGVALRHQLNESNGHLGHIGYGIRPSMRRRGLGSWALGRILDEARQLGLDRVLLVCASSNVASARTIERNGGVREGDSSDPLRYWIDLGAHTGGRCSSCRDEANPSRS